MTWELIDTKAIDDYLTDKAGGNEPLLQLMKFALGKVLAKREENTVALDALSVDAPDWAWKKLSSGTQFHRFEADSNLDRHVDHIKDWIAAAVANDAPWLNERDGVQPVRFKKLNTLEKLTAEADKDMRLANLKLVAKLKLVPVGEGEQEVMALENGYRFVKLTSSVALDREGIAMGHCIGQGAYDGKLAQGTHQFFSLRDKHNKPHATLEVDTECNTLIQCKGKESKSPIEKYLPSIGRFVQGRNLQLAVLAHDCGLAQDIRGDVHSIYFLPEGLRIAGHLDLTNLSITCLPKGLMVGGSLDLRGTPITQLPESLRVIGNLDISDTPITQLPEGLQVGWNLNIRGTRITRLPKGLKVYGKILSDPGQLVEEKKHTDRLSENPGGGKSLGSKRTEPVRRDGGWADEA